MRPRSMLVVMAGFAVLLSPLHAAEQEILKLRNNPFSQPEVVNKPPPPRVAPVVVIPPEQVELRLTATMVSETIPMVVVDGKLLGIGDKIEGLKLIGVLEGRAIFSRAGRKYAFSIVDGKEK